MSGSGTPRSTACRDAPVSTASGFGCSGPHRTSSVQQQRRSGPVDGGRQAGRRNLFLALRCWTRLDRSARESGGRGADQVQLPAIPRSAHPVSSSAWRAAGRGCGSRWSSGRKGRAVGLRFSARPQSRASPPPASPQGRIPPLHAGWGRSEQGRGVGAAWPGQRWLLARGLSPEKSSGCGR